MASRRSFLKLMGGGVVVAIAAGGGCMAIGGVSQSAREPWRLAGQYEDIVGAFCPMRCSHQIHTIGNPGW